VTDQLFDLTGRRTLVTGASRGIGREIALALASRGADVLAVARSKERLAEAAALGRDSAGSISVHAADLSGVDAVERCVEACVDVLGGIDVLVNNAAAAHESAIEDTDLETWTEVLDLNLRSCWLLSKLASPLLRDGGGKVINVSSKLGLIATPETSAYVAAKHALIGLTRSLALEWARRDVQVNAIAPGFVDTEMNYPLFDDQEVVSYIRRTTPMGRWGEPGEFAGPAVFLASHASDFMTGQVLVVDGGWTAHS
jgi:NAD(P)-dependent dehydrogenase (short-subunit alcohol dehydrogenase family)